MQIGINFNAIEALEDLFSEMKNRATDLSPIGSNLADIMRDDVRKRFATAPSTEIGGMVYGGAYWDKLTDASFVFNPQRRNKKVGIDTGELRNQATVEGSGNLYQVDGTNFIFELTSQKAENFAAERPLVYWHPELLRRIGTEIVGFIVEVTDG